MAAATPKTYTHGRAHDMHANIYHWYTHPKVKSVLNYRQRLLPGRTEELRQPKLHQFKRMNTVILGLECVTLVQYYQKAKKWDESVFPFKTSLPFRSIATLSPCTWTIQDSPTWNHHFLWDTSSAHIHIKVFFSFFFSFLFFGGETWWRSFSSSVF